MPDDCARIVVLAGTNGAGKSSIAGAFLRHSGGHYYNPDEVARQKVLSGEASEAMQASSIAWRTGVSLLQRSIDRRENFVLETTLGGKTITGILESAAILGAEVRVWYIGLVDPHLHIARVASRVAHGGHAILEATIRQRFDDSRCNLIRLMPVLTELKVYDNSIEADPILGKIPEPQLLLWVIEKRILAPQTFVDTPQWAKPIVAKAIKLAKAV